MTQPKALHLAAYWSMKDDQGQYVYPSLQFRDETAAELRRLHELAMDQQGRIYALEMARSMQQKTAKLKHDALLEALREIERSTYDAGTAAMARVAIAKAEENT